MKRKYFLCFVVLFLLTPSIVLAKEPTDKMFIDYQILENGDLKVKEVAELSGSYHGRTRTILYRNSSAPHFTGKASDFDGSDLYNGTSISIDKVADIKLEKPLSFASMDQLNNIFTRVYDASTSTYQVYTQQDLYDGVDLKIYNPDQKHTAFYIEYTVKDAVVVHEDVAELAWNVLGSEYQENIGTLKIRLHLPREDATYRVWLKGPLNGEVTRENDSTAFFTYSFLGAYNPVTIRTMFDKTHVPYATKTSGVLAKQQILESEKRAADLANQERERIRMQNSIFYITLIIWILLLVGSLGYLFFLKKKNRKVNFAQDYYRDFPASYGPEVLEYLLDKKVTEKSLSAVILSLVEKKVLEVSEIESKKKKDYLLTRSSLEISLSEVEQEVLTMLFKEIGDGKSVSLSAIKNYGKNYSHATGFIASFNRFVEQATSCGRKEGFFEKIPRAVSLIAIVTGLGILLATYGFFLDFVGISILVIFASIFSLVFVLSSKFYTEKGREDLAKWKAFKHFLEDFSTFDTKELPEVALWSRYLVYATVLGCAETLQKQMKIKIDAMQGQEELAYDTVFWNRMYLYNTLSYSVNQSIHAAVSSSRSSIAASKSSSGGGFGGGASFGGGSFGGGGGGGRF